MHGYRKANISQTDVHYRNGHQCWQNSSFSFTHNRFTSPLLETLQYGLDPCSDKEWVKKHTLLSLHVLCERKGTC